MATSTQQTQLHKTIWSIADQLRGAIDGWEFKSYILVSLFYRFISENLTQYVNKLQEDAGVSGFDYTTFDDAEAQVAKDALVAEKGYFILPSQLFCNVCKNCEKDQNLNQTLAEIFRSIEGSAQGTRSEDTIKGLFTDFEVNNSHLGATVVSRNKLIARVLLEVQGMELSSSFQDNNIDAFGDAYEFLMGMYASNAGKSGGQFFTPQEVSEVLARITLHDNKVESVYDPACGSGSLLLKFAKIAGDDKGKINFYGQEINFTTYNLCRMNMFLHNINYDKFDICCADTLINPQHLNNAFDAIVSNPPYSIPWEGKDNPLLINDPRFAPAAVLAPKSKADLAFTMHMLYQLKETGTAAIVEFPGVLYRGGEEAKIRQYLVDNNYVDTVIQLPDNLFFGVGISTCIIVLRKGKRPDSKVLFIDASAECVKSGNKNMLSAANQDHIVKAFTDRKEVKYMTKLVDKATIAANGYNLSVSSYVEKEDKREPIIIAEVNARVQELEAEGNALRQQIAAIIKSMPC